MSGRGVFVRKHTEESQAYLSGTPQTSYNPPHSTLPNTHTHTHLPCFAPINEELIKPQVIAQQEGAGGGLKG